MGLPTELFILCHHSSAYLGKYLAQKPVARGLERKSRKTRLGSQRKIPSSIPLIRVRKSTLRPLPPSDPYKVTISLPQSILLYPDQRQATSQNVWT